MHRAIAASKYAFRIDMADWLAENLAEAREWLCADDSAPEWKRFTRYVLGLRRTRCVPTTSASRKREALTRKVVRGLYVSDARLRQPLGPRAQASTISSSPASASTRSRATARVASLHAQRDLDAPARRHVHHPRVASVQGIQVRRSHVPRLEPDASMTCATRCWRTALRVRASTRRSSPAATTRCTATRASSPHPAARLPPAPASKWGHS